MTDEAQIRLLEERAFNAWPALRTKPTGGWLLRLSEGFTKRANSANAHIPDAPFPDVQAAAEAFYTDHHLPTIFRLTPLAGEEPDRILAAADYSLADPSIVMSTPLGGREPDETVILEDRPSAAWLEGIAAANAVPEAKRRIHDRMVQSIAPPTAFATALERGQPLGFGLAVCERGAVGLFDIVVSPAARCRGIGRRLTSALLAWGHSAGAESAYLQVLATNHAALSLYAGLGFVESYRYHYRIKP
jgi:ribosomal protein S18 acetylase RimI-like enzyme